MADIVGKRAHYSPPWYVSYFTKDSVTIALCFGTSGRNTTSCICISYLLFQDTNTHVLLFNFVCNMSTHCLFDRADVCIIGIAGSSGSGKSTLSHAIVSKLNLPWVVILSMVAIAMFWLVYQLIDSRTLSTRILTSKRLEQPSGMNTISMRQMLWISTV